MLLRSIAFAAVLAVVSGCSGDESEAANNDHEIVVKNVGGVVEVKPDRLIYPRALFTQQLRARVDQYRDAIAAGRTNDDVENVIVVGDRQADAVDEKTGMVKEDVPNPYGYIRRALSYEDKGDTTVVMTEEATLEDAFKELDENGEIEIGSDPTKPGQVKPQISAKLKATIPVINFSGKELYRQGDAALTVKSGKLDVTTKIDLGAKIGFFRLNQAHVIVDATLGAELVVEAAVGRDFSKSFRKPIFKGRWPVGSIGPIPVTAGITTSIACEVGARAKVSASAGARAEVRMKAGVRYKRGNGAEAVFEGPRFEPQVIKPTFKAEGGAGIECRLEPEINVMLYDVAGPTATAAPYTRLDIKAPPPQASLKVGFDVNVGGKLRVFGKNLGEINKQVYSVEKEIWKGP